MKVLLYCDPTIRVDIEGVANYLGTITPWSVSVGARSFDLKEAAIRYPVTYDALPPAMLAESQAADLAIAATRIPYENNFFFLHFGSLSIVSFYAWEHLTALPLENGLVYFLVSVLRYKLPLDEPHEDITGCLHDFLWDKTGVDVGMRFAGFCPDCIRRLDTTELTPSQYEIRIGISRVLRDLGQASRRDTSVLEAWRHRPFITEPSDDSCFDVFICHNSADKTEVRAVCRQLSRAGIRVWLDEEQLRPGLPWQVTLESQIGSIASAAVFVGVSGIGPWQDMEMRAFLAEFARRQCAVIPVILSNAGRVPELPIFLRQMTWVDYRDGQEQALRRLLWGITGQRVTAHGKR